MSQNNSKYNHENNFYNSSHDSVKENILFHNNNKANHIIIDSGRREEQFQENNKFYDSSHYEHSPKRNDLKINGNGLPAIKNKKSLEEGKFSKTYYKNDKATVKILKKKLNELNGEINKLKNDSNVQNYNILELNYKQKSKELTELKQENNFIRFQLEDLIRKNSRNKNKKKSANKLGSIRDYHLKLLFSRGLQSEEENKEINSEEDMKKDDYIKKNEVFKRNNEMFNKELQKYKKELNITKNQNNELKQNIIRLNNAIKLNAQKNNNDNYEKNELNIKIYELNEEKESLRNDLNNLKKLNEKNKDESNKYKKEINELNNAFLKTNSIIEQKDLIIKNLKENPNNNNNELEKVINQLKQENKNLTDELMKNNISNKSNQNEEELKNKINLLNLKISSLNEENEYYKNKAEELHEQLKNVYKLKNNTENTLDMIINFSEKDLDKKENNNLENSNNINQLKQEIINLKNLNQKLQKDFNQEKNKNIELIKNKELPDNMNINDRNDNNVDLETKLKKKEEEIEALNTFTFKLQKELENSKEKNEIYESKINLLTKENISIKNQLERLSKTMPNEINALKFQLDEANKRNQINLAGHSNLNKINEKSKIEDANETQAETHNNLLLKLNEKNKEISELKNQNKELRFKLEEKEVKSAYSGYRTEDFNISNYEEEFDLRKMANGAKEKNRSEDVNIDYPGIQEIKDKLKELTFKYTNLVEQVKILLGNINFTNKAKPQITQICQLIGYSPRTTARIFSFPKEKKKLLGIN